MMALRHWSRRLSAVAFTVLLFASAGIPAQPAAGSGDAVLDARVKAIADELRCLVCQNQTIADSHAELAIDLRNQVIAQVKAGKSDDEIRQYMVDRYGEFVLFRPRLNAKNLLLWGGPFVLLLAGVVWVSRMIRRGRTAPEEEVDPEALARARAALAEGEEARS